MQYVGNENSSHFIGGSYKEKQSQHHTHSVTLCSVYTTVFIENTCDGEPYARLCATLNGKPIYVICYEMSV